MFRQKFARLRRAVLPVFLPLLLLSFLVSPLFAQKKPEFKKENRSEVVAYILRALAKKEGATTSMSDSGSGKITSDMDVTCKFVLTRPDGSKDFDLTSRFIDIAKVEFPSGDFAPDKYGCLQSVVLDTAVHDAKNAVPDFHSALSLNGFHIKYMEALQKKLNNPDAYFTGGGNRKQVDQRMQSSSRLRVFDADGRDEKITVDRSKPDEYMEAMKKYFDMNPEEVLSRKRTPDLFGDSFDAFRQATLHEHGDDLNRSDGKYNTRIIDNYLEMAGYPGNWKSLTAEQKADAMGKIFPNADQADARARTIGLLDQSFTLYDARGDGKPGQVPDMAEFHEVSAAFQKEAIAACAVNRMKDVLDPRISMEDVYDHAQALAQDQGKSWLDMGLAEQKHFVDQAKSYESELVSKLKFAAAGEMAMAMKFLGDQHGDRVEGFKKKLLAAVPEAQRKHVETQMKIAMAYLRDSSNRAKNVSTDLFHTKGIINDIKASGLVSPEALEEARKQRSLGYSFRKLLMSPVPGYAAYKKLQEDWQKIKEDLDPTAERMANTLDKLDKAQSVLNLIKVYQDSDGDPDAMKKAIYTELLSRNVPGYSSYQMYKQWQSGDPAAQEELVKSLVFQGLTMLPGGAIAQVAKLSFDVVKTGLEITVGYELHSMGKENVTRWLEGGDRDSILYSVPGANVQEKERNYFKWMVEGTRGGGVLAQAYKNVQKVKKLWESLPPYKKAYREDQERYQRKIDVFYALTKKRIEDQVDNYIADSNLAGTVATGSRDMMIQILLADFTNGLNREMNGRSLNVIEQEAAKEASLLEEIDDWMYGLFSSGLDKVWDTAAALRPRPVPTTPGRWGIKVSEARDEAGEIHAEAQVVPPVNQTFEERITIYELSMVGAKIDPPADPARTEIPKSFKVTVEFELVNTKTSKKPATKTFEYKRGDLGPPSGVGHHIEYLGDDPKMGKTEEYDFILLSPDVFYEKASKIFGRQPTKEERDDAEYRNASMVMNLDAGQLLIELTALCRGDKKKAEDLMNQIGQGLLWIYYHGTYISYRGGKKDYQRQFKEGIAEGEHIGRHENGKIKEKGRFSGNAKTGEWQTFDLSERLVKTEFYEKDKPVWSYGRSYHSNGKLASDGPRRITAPGASSPDVSDGPFVEYYENGTTKQRGQYNKNRRSGLWETWDEKGTLRQKAVYSDPPDSDRDYFVTNYDQQGQLTEEGGYDRMGQKHGTWVEVSGVRKITLEYNHGRVVRR